MEAVVGVGVSRRQMLAAVGLAGLAASVPAIRRVALPSIFRPQSVGTGGPANDELTLARFAPHIGSRFTVNTGRLGGVAVTLGEATATGAHPADRPGLRGEAFSLIFRGAGANAFANGTHTLVHPALGAFALYLVAVGPGRNGQEYQAIIDHRVPTR